MQPDTTCHHARSASWETERREKGGREEEQASEKAFLIRVPILEGVVSFLRKVLLPEKPKHQSYIEEKPPTDWEQIVQLNNSASTEIYYRFRQTFYNKGRDKARPIGLCVVLEIHLSFTPSEKQCKETEPFFKGKIHVPKD